MAQLRVRRDVWTLSVGTIAKARSEPWDPILDAYARGVQAMKDQDGQDRADSWEWAANTHGVPDGTPKRPMWAQCEHRTPFFLPWHRAYLRWFERTIQKHIHDDEWALPYWDYTDPSRPETLGLPPEFLVPQRTVATGLEDNPLFADRDGSPIADDVEIVIAMKERAYVRRAPNRGFGGVIGAGLVSGLLELEPHNLVHGDIGGGMGDPRTAGGDPIFWLHHANIDRLWEVWLQLRSAGNPPVQPGAPRALVQDWNSAAFAFGAEGAPATYSMAQVEAPGAEPMRYRYESTDLPAMLADEIEAAAVPVGGPIPLDDEDPDAGWEPAASVPDIDVTADAERVDLQLDGPGPLGLGGDEVAPVGLIVELAHVRGEDPHHVYVVDVSAGPDAPPRRAGRFSTFGIAHREGDPDSSYLVDATPLVPQLLEDGWDGQTLSVYVEPDPDRRELESQQGSGVRIGQVTLYVRR